MSLDQFLALLFDPGQASCFTSDPHGWRVKERPEGQDIFFSINALHANRDLDPSKEWHQSNQGRRSDKNVTYFRNFLLELDSMQLGEQVPYIKERLPVSTITYSGGKSHHFILSLLTPVSNYEEYMSISRRLHKLVPEADPTTKNPSRLSRLPFRTRPDTGKEQTLVYLGERIPNEQLLSLLPSEPQQAQTVRPVALITTQVLDAVSNPQEAMHRYNLPSRNLLFYWLHNRMKEAGISRDAQAHFAEQMYYNLKDKSDFDWSEAQTAARLK